MSLGAHHQHTPRIANYPRGSAPLPSSGGSPGAHEHVTYVYMRCWWVASCHSVLFSTWCMYMPAADECYHVYMSQATYIYTYVYMSQPHVTECLYVYIRCWWVASCHSHKWVMQGCLHQTYMSTLHSHVWECNVAEDHLQPTHCNTLQHTFHHGHSQTWMSASKMPNMNVCIKHDYACAHEHMRLCGALPAYVHVMYFICALVCVCVCFCVGGWMWVRERDREFECVCVYVHI